MPVVFVIWTRRATSIFAGPHILRQTHFGKERLLRDQNTDLHEFPSLVELDAPGRGAASAGPSRHFGRLLSANFLRFASVGRTKARTNSSLNIAFASEAGTHLQGQTWLRKCGAEGESKKLHNEGFVSLTPWHRFSRLLRCCPLSEANCQTSLVDQQNASNPEL